MGNINIVVLFITIYQLYKLMSLRRRLKDSGKKLIVVDPPSTKLLIVILLFGFFIGLVLTFGEKTQYSLINGLMFYGYLGMLSIEVFKKTTIYENGIYHQGKFIEWQNIKEPKLRKDGLLIELEGKGWWAILITDQKEEIQSIIDYRRLHSEKIKNSKNF